MKGDSEERSILRTIEEAWAEFRFASDNRLDSREERVKMGWNVYIAHGCPFGESAQAINIWFHFRQRSTPN